MLPAPPHAINLERLLGEQAPQGVGTRVPVPNHSLPVVTADAPSPGAAAQAQGSKVSLARTSASLFENGFRNVREADYNFHEVLQRPVAFVPVL